MILIRRTAEWATGHEYLRWWAWSFPVPSSLAVLLVVMAGGKGGEAIAQATP
jgi:hypothetical protein